MNATKSPRCCMQACLNYALHGHLLAWFCTCNITILRMTLLPPYVAGIYVCYILLMAPVPHAHAGDTHPVDSLLTLGKESDIFIEQCMGPIKDFAALPNNSQYLLNVRAQLPVAPPLSRYHLLESHRVALSSSLGMCTAILHHPVCERQHRSLQHQLACMAAFFLWILVHMLMQTFACGMSTKEYV